MHVLEQRTLGIAVLFLLGFLVLIKRVATGSIFDKPKGNFSVQFVNVFNLFFLLVVNPFVAVLLLTRRLTIIDPTHMAVHPYWVLIVLEIIGLTLYVSGFFLMGSALYTLGRNYQLGGCTPRSGDTMVTDGPYRLVRHPMYTAALSISFGLSCIIQSLAVFGVFCIYLVLVLLLIPIEENGLRQAYGPSYHAYRKKTKMLLPFVY